MADPDDRRVVYRSLNKLMSMPRQDASTLEILREIRRRWQLSGTWASPESQQPPVNPDALLVSFPRAGSNFLQNVIGSTFGGTCISMYQNWPTETHPLRTIKSHAPTPAYLEEECTRHAGKSLSDKPCILLLRDPRDVIISFYEFTMVKLNRKLDQGTFLEETDYFLSSAIDLGCQRRSLLSPLSIKSALNAFFKTWTRAVKSGRRKILTVHYENLVKHPIQQATCIGDNFGWKPIANSEHAPPFELVSQVSKETERPRGRPRSWTLVQEQYADLLQTAEHLIDEAIRLFETSSQDKAKEM